MAYDDSPEQHIVIKVSMRRKQKNKGLKLALSGLLLIFIPLALKFGFIGASSPTARQIGNAFSLDGFALVMIIGMAFFTAGMWWLAWDVYTEANA